ncbi:MAG TPA: hypothetical protein VGQ53_19025 [Chitinophagaceae bacterium]|jgi:hypothetical protein|nr:hypothetical protein [Chitinophagaceae bacterium]
MQLLEMVNQNLDQKLKVQGDSLSALRQSLLVIQKQINQKNVHGNNFGGDQNNYATPTKQGK